MGELGQVNTEANTYGDLTADVYESADKEKQNPSLTMVTFRGLYPQILRMGNGRARELKGYIDILPSLEGKNFIELVNEKIAQRKKEATENDRPYEKVVITDLLYGKGQFLLDCRKEWGDDVELIGLGSEHHTKIPSLNGAIEENPREVPPTYDALQQAGVKLVNGHVIDMRKVLGNASCDFIVDSNALMYVNYPAWEMVKKVYRTLKPDGIALLGYDAMAKNVISSIQPDLQSNGYKFEVEKGISFRKSQPDINLPIRTTVLTPYYQEAKPLTTRR